MKGETVMTNRAPMVLKKNLSNFICILKAVILFSRCFDATVFCAFPFHFRSLCLIAPKIRQCPTEGSRHIAVFEGQAEVGLT